MKSFTVPLIALMMLSVIHVTFARKAVCLKAAHAGYGNLAVTRYYWDTAASQCRRFTYKGNGGNGNRFATLAACKSDCQN